MEGNIPLSNIYIKEIYFTAKKLFTYGELETQKFVLAKIRRTRRWNCDGKGSRNMWLTLPSRYWQWWHMDNMALCFLLCTVPVDTTFMGWGCMLWYAQLLLHLCNPLGLIAAVGGILIARLGRGLSVFLRYCLIPIWIITMSEYTDNKKNL